MPERRGNVEVSLNHLPHLYTWKQFLDCGVGRENPRKAQWSPQAEEEDIKVLGGWNGWNLSWNAINEGDI